MKENSTNEIQSARPLATQPLAFRAYDENYAELMAICERTGRKPAEELRDILDEALSLRRRREEGDTDHSILQTSIAGEEISKLTEVLERVAQKNTNQTQMILHLARHMREQYGLILETLAGGYGARYLVWKYVAEPTLREEGFSTEKIRLQYETESKVWNHERDTAADMIEQAIRNLGPVVNEVASNQ